MSESMTIDQVREERRALAEQIRVAIKAFNEKTGIDVEHVSLNYLDHKPLSGASHQFLASVEVELSI
jgi:hypothetical protein